MEDRLYTPQEVAKRYRVHPKTVVRWARSGRLTGIKLNPSNNGEYRFTKQDLEDFEANCRGGRYQHEKQDQGATTAPA